MLRHIAPVVDTPSNPSRTWPVDGGDDHHDFVILQVAYKLEVLSVGLGENRMVGEQVHDHAQCSRRIEARKHLCRNLHHDRLGKGLGNGFALVPDLWCKQYGIE